MSKTNSNHTITMEELLASQTKKLITLSRGQQVEGVVVSISDKEIILDLGAKSEGVLQAREMEGKEMKVGDKIKVFVTQTDNESGQVVVSLQKSLGLFSDRGRGGHGRQGHFRGIDWTRFQQAQSQKTRLQAAVLEINKGGLIVEVDGTRGFLPNSQVGFELISKSGQGMDALIGQTLALTVIEVDSSNNKLIFTQRGQVTDEVKEKLKAFKNGQKVQGKVVAILPFGLVIDVLGTEGLVFISDASWERVEDLSTEFKTGQELDVVVIGIDIDLGRLNLSIKQLSDDPFSKLSEKFATDEVVKGEITNVSEAGVFVKLADPAGGASGVEGFMSLSVAGSGTYEVGKSMSFLVDNVDAKRRKVNLAPFVTSTAGLIYK